MKNWLLKTLVSLFRPNPNPVLSLDQSRVLVVTTTALGDTLWATPALKALKTHIRYLAVLTSPIGAEILKNNPFVDQIFVLKRLKTLRKTLLRHRFDTVLIFHTSQRVALPLVSSIGASRIVGTTGINKGLDALLTHPIAPVYEHEIARRLRIANTIGVPVPKDQTLSFFLRPEEELSPLPGLKIAIHPGSQDRFKRWPKENFAKLGQRLKEFYPDCQIFLTGSAKEKELLNAIAREIPGAKIDDINRPLRLFAAFLKNMDLVISNDTGPTHLAWALERPAISLYGPTDPNLCGPHQAKNGMQIAYPPTCKPCVKRSCRAPFCLLQIGIEEVFQKALDILAQKSSSTSNVIPSKVTG